MPIYDEPEYEKPEFLCPFCHEFIEKKYFSSHRMSHRNDPMVLNYPESLEQLKARFEILGYWDER